MTELRDGTLARRRVSEDDARVFVAKARDAFALLGGFRREGLLRWDSELKGRRPGVVMYSLPIEDP